MNLFQELSEHHINPCDQVLERTAKNYYDAEKFGAMPSITKTKTWFVPWQRIRIQILSNWYSANFLPVNLSLHSMTMITTTSELMIILVERFFLVSSRLVHFFCKGAVTFGQMTCVRWHRGLLSVTLLCLLKFNYPSALHLIFIELW